MTRRLRAAVRSALAALLFALPVAASAQSFPVTIAPDYTACQITSTAVVSCHVPVIAFTGQGPNAKRFLGLANLASANQTATITCWDNASAASGTVVFIGLLQSTQYITLPPPGRPLINGLTCQFQGALVGTGAEVYVR